MVMNVGVAHPYVIILLILSFVVIQEVLSFIDEPYLKEYNPFKPQNQRCEEKSDSCYPWSSGSSKKKHNEEPNHNSGYKQKQFWSHFFGTNELTLSVGDYFSQELRNKMLKNQYISYQDKKIAGCKQAIVISARGVKLDGNVMYRDCKGDNPLAQFMFIDDALWYYPTMRVTWDSSRQRVVVATIKSGDTKETASKMYCEKKYYNIQPGSSNVKEEKTESVEANKANDDNCVAINKGETGTFPISSVYPISTYTGPHQEWGVNIVGEGPFGVKMIKYKGPFCHWKVVMFWNGYPFTGTAMFCGDFRGMVVTETGLYFGNHMAAMMSPDSTEVAVLLNPRNGDCVKQHYKMKKYKKEEKTTVEKQSITTLHEADQECENFKQGKLSEKQMDSGMVASVEKLIMENKIDVVPYEVESYGKGPSPLSEFPAKLIYIDINMGRDMGVIIHKLGTMKAMTLVAQGVVIDVAIIKNLPIFSVQKDTIICGDQVIFKRDAQDTNLFTVTAKWDSRVCTRTRYILVNKDGKLYRQEIFPAEIGVSNYECRSLIERGFDNEKESDKQSKLAIQLNVLQPTKIDRDLADYIS